MSVIEGYCIVGKADEPLDAERFCLAHRMVGIPPTFGRRTQRWIAGAWSPPIEKPEGYRYRPRYTDEPIPKPETARQITATVTRPTHCERCKVSLDGIVRGGSVQRYCSTLCKTRAGNKRHRERQKARAAS